jgi:predicted patatin/cPLA2 family phospholipase
MEHVPLQQAIDDGAEEIDVIILRPEFYDKENWNPDNMFDVMLRTIDLMQKEISTSDVLIGKLKAGIKEVKLNFYYTPYNLTNNALVFNKEEMLKWWKEGYEYVKQNGYNKSFVVNSDGFKTIKV